MLNTSNWKEFRMANIFDIEHVKKFTLPNKPYVMDGDIISPDGINPYIAAISTNNGIKGYSNYDVNNEGDCITLSTTADSSNTVFYQKNAFIGRQQIAGIRRKDGTMGEHCGLFIVSVLKPLLRLFNYGNKLTIDYLRDLYITLPATLSGEPDWNFMEQYIAELEEERVAELEEERVAELEAYLVSTGLDDYELTEEDKEVLSASPEWGEFRIGDLFDWENGNVDIKKKDINGKGFSVVSSGVESQGIIGKTDLDSRVHKANTITVDMFGNVYYRDFEYKMVTHARVFALIPKTFNINKEVGNYLVSIISKATSKFEYNNMCSFKKIQNEQIKLPVLPDGTPDFEYMEKYIRAIEKLTIQGVVEWKDKEIEKTKEIVA